MSHVDSTSPVTHVSLCAGYGGIDLGLSRAIPSLRTIAFSEIEAFACANLVSKMEAGLLDPAPIWTDLKTFPWAEFHGRVDILSGGYPCQPFSAAGKRLGAEDPRHLWPFIAAGIAAMRPSACFFENVEGHISLGLPDVLQDLAGMGYRTTWCVASASECGAPHQRKRVFILAHAQQPTDRSQAVWHEIIRTHAGRPAGWFGGSSGELADSLRQRGASGLSRSLAGHEGFAGIADNCGDLAWPSRPGEQQFAWEPPRVVVDAKSQRAGQRSELRSEECGSRGALPWDVEQSGEGAMENANELRLEEHGLLNAGVSVGSSGGSDEQTVGLPNAQDMRLEEQSECLAEREANGGGTSNAWGVHPCEAQEGRPLEHASNWSNGEQPTEQQGRDSVGGSSEAGAMGNAASERPQERPSRSNHSSIQATECGGRSKGDRQTQPSLGRDTDGLTHRLDHAVLHVSTDNRTDELRLLGNGVVPATAERAFRVLVGELMEHQP